MRRREEELVERQLDAAGALAVERVERRGGAVRIGCAVLLLFVVVVWAGGVAVRQRERMIRSETSCGGNCEPWRQTRTQTTHQLHNIQHTNYTTCHSHPNPPAQEERQRQELGEPQGAAPRRVEARKDGLQRGAVELVACLLLMAVVD